MEDSSINRSRGAENMTAEELDAAEAVVESETVLIDGSEIITDATIADGWLPQLLLHTGDVLGTVTDVASDVLAPVTPLLWLAALLLNRLNLTK